MTDQTSRTVFLKSLTREEQLGTLYDMAMARNNDWAKHIVEHDRMMSEVSFIKGELTGIGRRREDTLTTSQKFNVQYMKRSAGWVWYRDHVLASTLAAIQTLIVMAVLYLAFGGRIP